VREAVIVSTTRTPIGKAYRGALSDISGPQLTAQALTGPRDQAGITGEEIHDIVLGCAEGNRPATSLAGLKPVLGNRSSPTVTADYASQLYDGASAGSRRSQPPRPRFPLIGISGRLRGEALRRRSVRARST
jgi:hypothetical protein